jgi:hypothetical protein
LYQILLNVRNRLTVKSYAEVTGNVGLGRNLIKRNGYNKVTCVEFTFVMSLALQFNALERAISVKGSRHAILGKVN